MSCGVGAFFLVQWMPGPCTEVGIEREFSIISLGEIQENYRYVLEHGRITMATYCFRSGPNVGTMHRLCKILESSGDKAKLEKSMVQIMKNNEESSKRDRIIYTIDGDEKSDEATTEKLSRPPPWEVVKEMLTLLEENHKLRRENELLRDKLAKAVEVGDLKNILETTLLNIQQKQLTQSLLDQGGQALDCLLPTSNPAIMPRDTTHVLNSPTGRTPALPARDSEKQSASRLTMANLTPPQSCTAPVGEADNPYIVRVQSLAEPTPHQVGQVNPGNVTLPGSSINKRVREGYSSITCNSEFPSPNQGTVPPNQQQGSTRQRQIRAPLWQTNFVADGIVERLRNVRGGQQGSQLSNGIKEIPTASNQHAGQQKVNTGIQQKESTLQTNNLAVLDDSDKLVELVAGTGIKISRKQMRFAQRCRNFSQYTRNLMIQVFTTKELGMCSVTGYKATGRGSQNAVARPALDPTRVNVLIGAVQRRFPAVSHFKIKQIMSQKLMDIRKTMRNKQLRNTSWKRKALSNARVKAQIKADISM